LPGFRGASPKAVRAVDPAKENFARAEALIDKRIMSAKAHLEAKTDYAEARINLRNARQKLFASASARVA
jgi:multidrug resistance efflux pump